jgi:hypothetical protein
LQIRDLQAYAELLKQRSEEPSRPVVIAQPKGKKPAKNGNHNSSYNDNNGENYTYDSNNDLKNRDGGESIVFASVKNNNDGYCGIT